MREQRLRAPGKALPARWPHWGRGRRRRCARVAGSRVGDPRRRGAGAPLWNHPPQPPPSPRLHQAEAQEDAAETGDSGEGTGAGAEAGPPPESVSKRPVNHTAGRHRTGPRSRGSRGRLKPPRREHAGGEGRRGQRATSPAVPVSERPPSRQGPAPRAYVIGARSHWRSKPEEAQARARVGR